jgi:hypothetical protein
VLKVAAETWTYRVTIVLDSCYGSGLFALPMSCFFSFVPDPPGKLQYQSTTGEPKIVG